MNDFLWFIDVFFGLQISFFCNGWCFNVVLCFVAGFFIGWARRWGRASEFATLRTLCFLHWLYFLVSFKTNRILFITFKPQYTAECYWEFPILDGLGFFIISEKNEAKTPPCFIYSKRDQCRGMFCVSRLASHLFAYTWEKRQTVRRLGLLSHFDCYKIGVHWLIFVNCLSSCTWKLKSWS